MESQSKGDSKALAESQGDSKALAESQGVELAQEPNVTERRFSQDGIAYSYREFIDFFGEEEGPPRVGEKLELLLPKMLHPTKLLTSTRRLNMLQCQRRHCL